MNVLSHVLEASKGVKTVILKISNNDEFSNRCSDIGIWLGMEGKETKTSDRYTLWTWENETGFRSAQSRRAADFRTVLDHFGNPRSHYL